MTPPDSTAKVRRYGVRRMDVHWYGDLCKEHKCEPMYMAEECDAALAERDALLRECLPLVCGIGGAYHELPERIRALLKGRT